MRLLIVSAAAFALGYLLGERHSTRESLLIADRAVDLAGAELDVARWCRFDLVEQRARLGLSASAENTAVKP